LISIIDKHGKVVEAFKGDREDALIECVSPECNCDFKKTGFAIDELEGGSDEPSQKTG
jgi:hypothetical protein